MWTILRFKFFDLEIYTGPRSVIYKACKKFLERASFVGSRTTPQSSDADNSNNNFKNFPFLKIPADH